MVTQSPAKETSLVVGDELRRTFLDGPEENFVNYDAFELQAVRDQIRERGFAIVDRLVPLETLAAIREFWLNKFRSIGKVGRVTWAPYFGQVNTLGFSKDNFQCLYRSCDFLWNEPYDRNTREVCVRLNGIRNLILGLDPLRGVKFLSDRYGVFVTTSYYPPREGWLEIHADGVASDIPLLHHIVPLTIKGTDYAEGGLVVIDRTGREVDVDAHMTLGSVLFYDGTLKHGVRRIVPLDGKSVGRLQMFAIPTKFVNVEMNTQALGQVATRTFVQAKWLRLKNRLLLLLGFDQIIR